MTDTQTQFASQSDVLAAVKAIGLTTTGPALAAISKNCRTEFLDRLSQCVQQNDTDGKSRKYIEFLFKCLTPETLAHIQDIVPEATVDEVTIAAKKAPVTFITALNAAMDETNARREEALALLRSISAKAKASGESAQQSEAPSESLSVQPVATAATSEGRRTPPNCSAPIQGSESANSATKHESHHVYGSSFALCFNATSWNGTPGIMVDAASAQGPRSYDWKNAIHVWLAPIEVAATIAVLRKWRQSVEFAAHGTQNDKSFSIAFQKTHFFAKVSAKVDSGKTRAVQINPSDATAVSILFLKQLGAAHRDIPLTELLAIVRVSHLTDNAG